MAPLAIHKQRDEEMNVTRFRIRVRNEYSAARDAAGTDCDHPAGLARCLLIAVYDHWFSAVLKCPSNPCVNNRGAPVRGSMKASAAGLLLAGLWAAIPVKADTTILPNQTPSTVVYMG